MASTNDRKEDSFDYFCREETVNLMYEDDCDDVDIINDSDPEDENLKAQADAVIDEKVESQFVIGVLEKNVTIEITPVSDPDNQDETSVSNRKPLSHIQQNSSLEILRIIPKHKFKSVIHNNLDNNIQSENVINEKENLSFGRNKILSKKNYKQKLKLGFFSRLVSKSKSLKVLHSKKRRFVHKLIKLEEPSRNTAEVDVLPPNLVKKLGSSKISKSDARKSNINPENKEEECCIALRTRSARKSMATNLTNEEKINLSSVDVKKSNCHQTSSNFITPELKVVFDQWPPDIVDVYQKYLKSFSEPDKRNGIKDSISSLSSPNSTQFQKSTRQNVAQNRKSKISKKREPLETDENDSELDSAYKCDICQKTFQVKYNIVKHKKQVHGAKLYSCIVCSESFSKKTERNNHIKKEHHSPLGYYCPECEKYYLSLEVFTVHRKTMHTTSAIPDLVSCDLCDMKFKNHRCLGYHKTTAHAKKFKCPLCKNSYVALSVFMDHLNQHTGLKPYSCNYCNKKFRTHSTLSSHLKTHSKKEHVKCDICGKTFTVATIKCHKFVHSNEKNFECDFCGKKFRTPSSLYTHRLNHFPVQCRICKKRFREECYLLEHLEQHKGHIEVLEYDKSTWIAKPKKQKAKKANVSILKHKAASSGKRKNYSAEVSPLLTNSVSTEDSFSEEIDKLNSIPLDLWSGIKYDGMEEEEEEQHSDID